MDDLGKFVIKFATHNHESPYLKKLRHKFHKRLGIITGQYISKLEETHFIINKNDMNTMVTH